MTERPHDDRTRDITLPPLPDRPPSGLPRQWASPSPSPEHPGVVPVPPARGTLPAEQPTDELVPPAGPPRERTIAFASPDMAPGRPAPTVGPTPGRSGRWLWVVLSLVPVLVIAGAGVLLVLLLRGG